MRTVLTVMENVFSHFSKTFKKRVSVSNFIFQVSTYLLLLHWPSSLEFVLWASLTWRGRRNAVKPQASINRFSVRLSGCMFLLRLLYDLNIVWNLHSLSISNQNVQTPVPLYDNKRHLYNK